MCISLYINVASKKQSTTREYSPLISEMHAEVVEVLLPATYSEIHPKNEPMDEGGRIDNDTVNITLA